MYFCDGGTEHHLQFDEPFDHLAVRIPRKLLERRWSSLAEIGSFRTSADGGVVDRVLLPMAGAAIASPDERDLPSVAMAMSISSRRAARTTRRRPASRRAMPG